MISLALRVTDYFTRRQVTYPCRLAGVPEEVQTPEELEAALQRYYCWFTYRYKFAPIRSSDVTVTSDEGWGCLLRCTQMLVAHYLRLHGDPRDAKNLFYYFDDWSEYCIFSIHNLIRVMWTKKPFKPANWSPSQGCEGLRLAVQEARKKGLLHTALQVECSVAGTVYVEDIRRHWKEGAERVLLLVNLQAGKEDTIPATLADTVLQYLKEPECVGAVGGYGKQAYYIIGLSGSEILYLDPHLLVQRALSADHTTNVVPTVSNVRSFGVTSLSSSLFVAFAIDSPAHWDALHERLQRYEHKLFQVEPGSAPLTREQKAKRRQEGSSPLRDPSHSDRIESFSDDSS